MRALGLIAVVALTAATTASFPGAAAAAHSRYTGMKVAPKWHELSAEYRFDDYLSHFPKEYKKGSAEYMRRKEIFERKLGEILHHNQKPGVTWQMGVNRFTDRTSEELQRITPTFPLPASTGATKRGPSTSSKRSKQRLGQEAGRRRSVDWRTAQPPVLTGVKDQGYCGSCWAFGSTATLESHFALATDKLVELSPQQLVSCVPSWSVVGTVMGGCDGMFPSHAMQYLTTSNGLVQEFMYPYVSYFSQNVSQNGTWPACNNWVTQFAQTPVSGYIELTSNDQDGVMDAISNDGPVTAVIYVLDSFMSYEAGVYSNSSCEADNMSPSHVVQLIGYGHDSDLGVDYWLLRNSWSPYWGDRGYFRLLKTAVPQCGQMGWIVDNSYINVTSCGMCGVLTNNLYPIIQNQP
jgi:cathepsin L